MPFPDLDVYAINERTFVIDDLDFDYDAWNKEQAALRLLEAAALGISVEARNGVTSRTMAATWANGAQPYLLNLVATQALDQTMTASFDIAGGTNNVPYDIVSSTNLLDGTWTWLGIGYTSNRYTIASQPLDTTFYALAKPQTTMTVGWGNSEVGQCDVPYGLTNALAVAGGGGQSLALLAGGNPVAWGQDAYGQGSVPTNITGVAMIGAGWYHDVALLTNGTVLA